MTWKPLICLIAAMPFAGYSGYNIANPKHTVKGLGYLAVAVGLYLAFVWFLFHA
jgi:hypothetical protein